MTAKKTDVGRLLGGSRGAREIERPQVQLVKPVSSGRRVNVALRGDLHKALKRLAVDQEISVQELIDSIVDGFLQSHKNV